MNTIIIVPFKKNNIDILFTISSSATQDTNQLFNYYRILFKSSDIQGFKMKRHISRYISCCCSNNRIEITFSKHSWRKNDWSIGENRWPSSSGWSTTKPAMIGFRVDCRTLPMAVMTRWLGRGAPGRHY